MCLAAVNPPHDAMSGCDDVDAARGDEVAKAVERVLVLAAGDRNGQRAPDLGVAGEILGRDRLLEPERVQVGDGAPQRDGFGDAVRMVGVHQQGDAAAASAAPIACITAMSSVTPKPTLTLTAEKPATARSSASCTRRAASPVPCLR